MSDTFWLVCGAVTFGFAVGGLTIFGLFWWISRPAIRRRY